MAGSRPQYLLERVCNMVDNDTLDYEVLTGFAEVPPESLPLVMSKLLTSKPSSFINTLKCKLDDRCKKKGIDQVARLLSVSKEFLGLLMAEVHADSAWQESFVRFTSCEENYEKEKAMASQATISPSLVQEVVTMYKDSKLDLPSVLNSCGITEDLFNQWMDLYTGPVIEARDSDVYTKEFREKLCQEYITGEVTEADMEQNYGVTKMMVRRWFLTLTQDERRAQAAST